MKEKIAKMLSNYAHQRGGAAVDLTDPAVAADLAGEFDRLIKAETAASKSDGEQK